MTILRKYKKVYFTVATVLLLYTSIETLSFCVYYFQTGEFASPGKLNSQRKNYLISKSSAGEKSNFRIEDGIGTRVVHPYIGFVNEPNSKLRNITVDPIEPLPIGQCAVNSYGFVGDPPFPTKSSDKITIVLVGGSVSNQFNCTAGTYLISKLKESSSFKGKEINIIGLGVGAHHQPQQLMAVNYYLSQGGEYDFLINIDGFNEIFVPFVMAKNNMHPSYPLFWKQFIADFDSNEIRQIGRIEFLLDLKNFLAKAANFTTYSITSNVLWSFLDQIIDGSLSKSRITLTSAIKEKQQKKSFSSLGPDADYGDLDEFSANLWSRSSIQLAKISDANRAKYFHFLQPNIHVRGSKNLSEKERTIMSNLPVFIPPETTNLISKAYALLGARGGEISKSGGHFSNLSMLFKHEKGSVYIDAGGHLTPLGNSIMADYIAYTIIKNNTNK